MGFTFNSQISFPYLPIINSFADHAISKGLEGVVLPFASPLTFIGDTTKRFTPIAFSSTKSGTTSVPVNFDIQREWQEADFPLQGLTIAACEE